MLAGENGQPVGADFVGYVPVTSDAVSTHYAAVNRLIPQHDRSRIVADDLDVDATLHQLPRRQPRALKQGAGFVGKHGDFLTRLLGCIDDPQGRAVVSRGQAAGVAVGDDLAAIAQECRAVRANLTTNLAVFLKEAVRGL